MATIAEMIKLNEVNLKLEKLGLRVEIDKQGKSQVIQLDGATDSTGTDEREHGSEPSSVFS